MSVGCARPQYCSAESGSPLQVHIPSNVSYHHSSISKEPYHCKVNALLVLKGVEKFDEPFALSGCQYISLCEDVSNLIELEEKLLAHDFQSADLSCIFLRSKVYLPVATLSDLCQDLEVAMAKSSTSFSQIRALSTQVFMLCSLILGLRGRRRRSDLFVEYSLATLAIMDIAEQVKVMVEEV